jgi:HEPN domain-containing protein
MTNTDLAKDYLIRAGSRLKALEVLFREQSYPDVIRESQEILELVLKGYLRSLKIDPPKWHDVGSILVENKNILHADVITELDMIVDVSKYLRKERENAFYGDDDLIPLSSYDEKQALDIKIKTQKIFELIKKHV